MSHQSMCVVSRVGTSRSGEPRYLDEQRTWLYFDPHRATITPHQRLSRLNRWLYAALHEFDFPFLYNSRPLWDIVVILLSIGGIVVSGSTLWPMIKRLGRNGRRLASVVRSAGARQSVRVGRPAPAVPLTSEVRDVSARAQQPGPSRS